MELGEVLSFRGKLFRVGIETALPVVFQLLALVDRLRNSVSAASGT